MCPVLKTAQSMRWLHRNGLVLIRYTGNPLKVKVRVLYYLSEEGFEICTDEDRARGQGAVGDPSNGG